MGLTLVGVRADLMYEPATRSSPAITRSTTLMKLYCVSCVVMSKFRAGVKALV